MNYLNYDKKDSIIKTSKHAILLLDIQGYKDRIVNSDEDELLQSFDGIIQYVRSTLSDLNKINDMIHMRMYSDNFLIYAKLTGIGI